MCAPGKLEYLRSHPWRSGIWTLVFALGIMAGSFLAVRFLSYKPVEFLPASFVGVGGSVRLFIGGLLIGFGTRYAGGCTSGHSITGISNMNWPSLVATIFFFVGGLAVTWGLGDWIFKGIGQ